MQFWQHAQTDSKLAEPDKTAVWPGVLVLLPFGWHEPSTLLYWLRSYYTRKQPSRSQPPGGTFRLQIRRYPFITLYWLLAKEIWSSANL